MTIQLRNPSAGIAGELRSGQGFPEVHRGEERIMTGISVGAMTAIALLVSHVRPQARVLTARCAGTPEQNFHSP